MKSNLAHKQEEDNVITLHPSTAKKKERTAMSEKFDKGYVMSSRLYRNEVKPFLGDAARNVYAELEEYISGFNKESDFVSYSQLQGRKIDGLEEMKSYKGTISWIASQAEFTPKIIQTKEGVKPVNHP